MVVSLKANKKRIIAFLVLVVVVVGACIFLRSGGETEPAREFSGGTNEERIAFLQSFGWQTNAEPAETREVMIPAQFNDVYTTYNVMQKAQGFDLKPHAGETCTQYKYKINNYPNETEVYATLLVRGNLIIGGDIACAEVDGFMHGFAADSARYGETSKGSAAKQETSAPESSMAESSMTESSMAESGAQSSSMAGETSSAVAGDTEPTSAAEPQSAAESSVESTGGEAISEDAFPTD